MYKLDRVEFCKLKEPCILYKGGFILMELEEVLRLERAGHVRRKGEKKLKFRKDWGIQIEVPLRRQSVNREARWVTLPVFVFRRDPTLPSRSRFMRESKLQTRPWKESLFADGEKLPPVSGGLVEKKRSKH
jgi:hypothetical protein